MAESKEKVIELPKPASLLTEDYDTSKIVKSENEISCLNPGETSYSNVKAIAFKLENIFSFEESQALVALSEQQGFSKVSVNHGGKDIIKEDVRSGSRLIVDDEEFVEKVWARIRHLIPWTVKGAQVVGLNERLRFLKYVPGQFFAPHTDGSYARPENHLEISLLTIQMYLNDEFDGGETTFLCPMENGEENSSKRVSVKPKTGMALVFAQDLTHEGSLVKNGVKYTVRTDVMYRYGMS